MNRLWKREGRLFLKSPATLLLLLLLSGLSLFAAINGQMRVTSSAALIEKALEDDRAAYTSKTDRIAAFEAGDITAQEAASVRNAHQSILSQSSSRALTPPRAELGFLSAAVSRPTPDILPIGIQTRHRNPDTNLQNPANRLDGPFDLAFVLTWLAPLFVILLSYDLLARDREQGGARLLAAQAGSLSALLVRRAAIRFVAIFLPLAIILTAFTLLSERAGLPGALPALLVLLIGLALMIGFWVTLAAAINAKANSAAAAGLSLLTIWVVISLLVPAGISAGLQYTAPPPDRLKGVLELRSIESDLNRRRDAVSEAYYAAQPENAPVREGDEYETYFVQEFYPRVLAFDAAYGPLAEKREAARVEQSTALRYGAMLSPPLGLKLLINDLSGGGPERRVAFLDAADDYQARWRAHFNDKLASMRPLDLSDYQTAPVYHPVPEAFGPRYTRLGLLLLCLGLPFILALIIARRALRVINP